MKARCIFFLRIIHMMKKCFSDFLLCMSIFAQNAIVILGNSDPFSRIKVEFSDLSNWTNVPTNHNSCAEWMSHLSPTQWQQCVTKLIKYVLENRVLFDKQDENNIQLSHCPANILKNVWNRPRHSVNSSMRRWHSLSWLNPNLVFFVWGSMDLLNKWVTPFVPLFGGSSQNFFMNLFSCHSVANSWQGQIMLFICYTSGV